MASRFFAIGALAVLTTVAAVAAVTAVATMRHPHLRPATIPGTAHLHAFGSRGARQGQTALARPEHTLEDLRSIAPAARFQQRSGDAAPLVLIDAVTRGDPQQLKAALVALGVKHPAVYSNDVGGWLPVTQLQAAAARAEVTCSAIARVVRAASGRAR